LEKEYPELVKKIREEMRSRWPKKAGVNSKSERMCQNIGYGIP